MFVFLICWIMGIVATAFPAQVYEFYSQLAGPTFANRNSPRSVRIAGVLWLVTMAALTFFTGAGRAVLSAWRA